MFESYLNRVTRNYKIRTDGQMHKAESDDVMDATWWEDIQSRRAYIYDYIHDSEKLVYEDLDPAHDPLKTPVDIKFIVTQYETLSKDQVEYHIMFRPGHNIPVDYYYKDIGRFGSRPPIGLYIDIPDDNGVYNRWLICLEHQGNQFIKYSVLPCSYLLHWVYNHKLYDMCVSLRARNSYSSGVWQDNKTEVVQDQSQIYLPQCEYTKDIWYGQRFIVDSRDSVEGLNAYLAWRVTDVKNTFPKGITKLTLYQDQYDPNKDLFDPNTHFLYANYSSYLDSTPPSGGDSGGVVASIVFNGARNVYVGSSKKIALTFTNADGQPVDVAKTSSTLADYWSVRIGDDAVPADSVLEIVNGDFYTVKVKVSDYTAIGKVLYITAHDADGKYTAQTSFNILGL